MDNTPNFPDDTPNFPPPFSGEDDPQNEPPKADPDNPRWGALAGIGVWFASIAALVLASVLGAFLYLGIYKARGGEIPLDPDGMNQVLMSPSSILVQIIFTILGHILTIAICWAVATGMGKRPFKESIGWNWDEPSPFKKIGIIIGTVVLSIAIFQVVPYILPDSKKTPFSDMLKASQMVRYVVAFLAVFTAPAVEEFVYRGLLYSPLKRAIGTVGAVSIATSLFALVHVPQYWGAWASLVGLLLLSLALTVIRAMTKSIMPCVAIHTLFNSIGAIGILLGGEG
jgi:membrane protease YdiL (CAAX protease family)